MTMIRLSFFLSLIICFLGCQNVDYPKKPKNLISKDKMVDILTESYLANAARSIDNRAILDKGVKIDSLIYRNFGVDSLQFASSNAYYAADVNAYRDIFVEVETRLTAMQKEMDSIWERERLQKDSLDIPKVDKNQLIDPVQESSN